MHYFLTYKQIPGPRKRAPVEVAQVYGRAAAQRVIRQSLKDYKELLEQ
jgi:inorganic pyrophosphatase